MPAEMLKVGDLKLQPRFGWLEVVTEELSFITQHLHTTGAPSAALHAWCLPDEEQTPGPGIDLQKLVNSADADDPPGPSIPLGASVTWDFEVTNSGTEPLTGVVVTDSSGEPVTCHQTTLDPRETMECTLGGIAKACQRHNVGRVVAYAPDFTEVLDEDHAWYYGEPHGSLGLETRLNGFDADGPEGTWPQFNAGEQILWTLEVTNTGDVELTQLTVTAGSLPVTCPKAVLQPGESMTCTANSVAEPGQHKTETTATGATPCDTAATVSQAAYANYFVVVLEPAIDLEKLVNGQDADMPPGPTVEVGAALTWSFVVTNVGDVPLSGVAVTDPSFAGVTCPKTELAVGESMTCTVQGAAQACQVANLATVTDDRLGAVTCPKTALAAGESMTCTAMSAVVAGQYYNVGTTVGTPPCGPAVSAGDPAHYYGVSPSIGLEKLTNGEEADTAPGPPIPVGSPVLWTYVVTNTGDTILTGIAVTDDKGVAVTCSKTALEPGESMTCTASGTAVAGQYSNTGTARGTPAAGPDVTATDPSHYHGELLGDQGCTPGYWKNHTDSWPPTGYSPNQAVDTVFANVNTYYPTLGNATLLQALGFAGGPGGEGAAEILLRAAVAALLNASHPDVSNPRTAASVIADVNAALLQTRDPMLALAAQLDADNNLGCPLN